MRNPIKRITKGLMLTAGLIALGATIALVTINSKSQRARPDNAPAKDRLHWHARVAKENGKREIIVPGLNVDYDGSASSQTTNDVLLYYDVVRAQPVQAVSYPFDTNVIATWYKFRVLESLSTAGKVACPSCTDSDLPSELLPLASDEFLLWKAGGSLVVDGVTITMPDPGFPPFEMGREYLLFIAKRPSGVADVAGGSVGTFTVEKNGHISSVAGGKHPVTKRLLSDLGDSLDLMKLKLKTKALR
jgi:hypothetical protein